MFYDDGTELMHYGVKYRSGRYPYGSGDNPYQHDPSHVYGSDKHSFDTGRGFIDEINRLKKEGKKDGEIAEYFGMKPRQFSLETSIARSEVRREDYKKVKDLIDSGISQTEVARMLGKNESSIRTLLKDEKALTAMHKAEQTAIELKKEAEKYGMVDVGPGTELMMGINRNKMQEALYICEMDDFPVYSGRLKVGTNAGKKTTTTVLCKPGTEHREMFDHPEKIVGLKGELYSHDGGETFDRVQYPKSISSSRIKINYAETGGADKDGVIELRPGVKDLDLNGAKYAQVRIAVDDTHFLKGMAVYSDDIPDGYDVVFNTNKSSRIPMINKTGGTEEVLKKMKTANPDNPFGANIKAPSAGGQHYYISDDGTRQLSSINKVTDEGNWNDWHDTVAAQFLSKQPLKLINQQLDKTYDNYIRRYNEISELTNPTVKRNRLEEFADTCDGAAVDLKVAAFPRQSWKVILPSTSLKEDEIYAPTYNNGEKLALVRYPHQYTGEIPILTVNNNNKACEKAYKGISDAVAIHPKSAHILSGADFDGDTVLTIPVTPKSNIKNRKPFKELEDFEPKIDYATREVRTKDPKTGEEISEYYSEVTGKKIKVMKNTQNEMGRASNLITDMQLQSASDEHMCRAVKYAMVVIDAEKHKLDHKKAYEDCGIKELKKLYQGHINYEGKYSEGAASLISSSKSEVDVPERVGQPRINYDPKTKGPKQPREYKDPRTGEIRIDAPPEGTPLGGVYYVESGRKYLQAYNPETKKWVSAFKDKKTGDVYYKTGEHKDERTGKLKGDYTKAGKDVKVKEVLATQKSKAMAETHDAYTLSSGTQQENAYASYANKMKALANTARIAALDTADIPYNKEAARLYKNEVEHLKAQLAEVEIHQPKERLANRIATAEADKARANNPEMTNGEYKKLLQQRLETARASVGGKKPNIDISDQEWKAIQAGAVNKTTLQKILKATPSDKIDKLAMPKANAKLTTSQINQIKNMLKTESATAAQIAARFGISVTTVYKYGKGG